MSKRSLGLAEGTLMVWIGRSISVLGVAALLDAFLMSSTQIDQTHPAWLLLIGGAITGITMVLPLAAWTDSSLSSLLYAYFWVVLVGLATWPMACTPSPEWTGSPWIWPLLPVAIFAFARAGGGLWAAPVAVAVSVLYGWLRLLPSGGAVPLLAAVLDGLNLAVPTVFAILVGRYMVSQAGKTDAEWVESELVRSADSIEGRLFAERARLDALVHDEILTTLVSAAYASKGELTHVREQAEEALAVLDRAAARLESKDSVSALQVVEIVENVVEQLGAEVTIVARVLDDKALFPIGVVRAVSRATREAVLNAIRHAQAVTTLVTIEVAKDGVSVSVVDEGIGFDPAEVMASRLGIRVSLERRMALVGGSAAVTSAKGVGTRVELVWRNSKVTNDAMLRPVYYETWPLKTLMWVILGFYLLQAGVALLVGAGRVDPIDQGKIVVGMALAVVSLVVINPVQRKFLSARMAGVTSVLALLGSSYLGTDLETPVMWQLHVNWVPGVALVVCLALVLRGWPGMAWAGAVVVVLLVATGTPVAAWEASVLSLTTLIAAMTIASLGRRWIWRVQEASAAMAEASAAAVQARAERAALIVMREVWLADLEETAVPLLVRVANSSELTNRDRRDCLTMEAQLRDSIKARNLTFTVMSQIVAKARRRGIEVTLVDNRGSELPLAARKAALRELELLAAQSGTRRIVVRTAPAGYLEAVTLVGVSDSADPKLVRLGQSGELLE